MTDMREKNLKIAKRTLSEEFDLLDSAIEKFKESVTVDMLADFRRMIRVLRTVRKAFEDLSK